jgi:lipopolysaccharide transport system ATP-binding protein
MIKVENLSKRYDIGTSKARYQTIRDSISSYFYQLFQPRDKKRKPFIWALDNVSFEVQPGKVIGVIGRNGAGKSTLLKILAHITSPTLGKVTLGGRVGSLLEVGTGFHPELTGRENIFLNGAILGMKRNEITRKFDDIVSFAEIESFLDTPAKYYSSGMYMRLAFSVAAHLEPEILLVDEVLAVGDAAFQKKCLNRMGEIAGQGRTVLFVSHNLAAVKKLCEDTILLENGKLHSINPTDVSISKYLESLSTTSNNWNDRTGTHRVEILKVDLQAIQGDNSTNIFMGDPLTIIIHGKALSSCIEFTAGLQLVSMDGTTVLYGHDQYKVIHVRSNLEFNFKISINELLVMPGEYLINIWIGKSGIEEFDYIKGALKITVHQGEKLPITHSMDASLGLVFSKLSISSDEML